MSRTKLISAALGLLAGVSGLYAAVVIIWMSSIDYYYGVITVDPKVNPFGEREIAMLNPDAETADTILVTDFCLLPFTKLCRTLSADIHQTFIQGQSYCVSATGFRYSAPWGLATFKPNLFAIIRDEQEYREQCVPLGAPEPQG